MVDDTLARSMANQNNWNPDTVLAVRCMHVYYIRIHILYLCLQSSFKAIVFPPKNYEVTRIQC